MAIMSMDMTPKNNSRKKTLALLAAILGFSASVHAAGPPVPSSLNDTMVATLVALMLLLLLIIGLLANVLVSTIQYYQEKERKTNSGASGAALVAGLLLFSTDLLAQSSPTITTAAPYGNMSATAFYLIMGVIALEITVILFMLVQLKAVLAKEKARSAAAEPAKVKKPRISWWERMNKFRPVEQEADLDLGHEYDGIRELDNRLPPWWLWGFYITIIAGGIYLWRFHVSHVAPLSGEEFEISMKAAEKEKEEYLKKAANLIDENNVALLTTGYEIETGKSLFTQNCVACHGKVGEGGVGPNLTDDYWLHGGDIKQIFFSIKYGWQDKGMKSWKEDFTPTQMAQLSSYIHTLKGTNPPNPKAPQGELFKEVTGGDTSSVKKSL
jgi:cytochrome c oxidase cbb3-type subunit 3